MFLHLLASNEKSPLNNMNRDFRFNFENRGHCTPVSHSCALLEGDLDLDRANEYGNPQSSPKRRRIRLDVSKYAALRSGMAGGAKFCGLIGAVEVHRVRFRSHRGED